MRASQLHAVAGIERRLPRHAPHESGSCATDAGGVLIGVVARIELELVVDRLLLLDGLRAAQFGLVPAFGVGRVLIVAIRRRRVAVSDRRPRRQRQRAPVVRLGSLPASPSVGGGRMRS